MAALLLDIATQGRRYLVGALPKLTGQSRETQPQAWSLQPGRQGQNGKAGRMEDL